jgi:hypothetical protein
MRAEREERGAPGPEPTAGGLVRGARVAVRPAGAPAAARAGRLGVRRGRVLAAQWEAGAAARWIPEGCQSPRAREAHRSRASARHTSLRPCSVMRRHSR